jgi:nucleoside-diphosphate-sugar epimerase
MGDAAQRPWVIVGCGYTGLRLATMLAAESAPVVAVRRNTAALDGLDPAIRCIAADIAGADAVSVLSGAIPRGAVVVDSVPPGASDNRGELNLVAAAVAAGASRLVYVSSTGVYGRAGGEWVDEDTPVDPLGPRGAQRLDAEVTLLDAAAQAGLEAVALRVAGIYGPGRGVVARMRAGTYRVIGDGDTHVSRIHVRDLCATIIAAGTVSPLPRRIYTVADDEPTTSRAHADAVARAIDAPPAPSVPLAEVSTSVAAMLSADRRISNRRIKDELGVELRFPTWRDGLAEELA